MMRFILTVCLLTGLSGCKPAPSESRWFVQDYVIADPSLDPYCYSDAQRQEQDQWTPVRYLRLDQVPAIHAADRQNFASFLMRAYDHSSRQWRDRALSIFDFPPYFQAQTNEEHPDGGWGGDVYEFFPPYVSIVGTNDSGGTKGWLSDGGESQCHYSDGWIVYEVNSIPISSDDNIVWSEPVQSNLKGVPDPKPGKCVEQMDTATTRWTLYREFSYAAADTCSGQGHKRIDTIVSDHDGGDHHEVFYYTDVYGLTRWERWQCRDEPYDMPPEPDYAQRRCAYLDSDSQSIMSKAYPVAGQTDQFWQIRDADGQYCQIQDCRDNTTIQPLPEPGWIPASWPPGAQLYFTGNLLLNGDFRDVNHAEDESPLPPDPSWTLQGDMRAQIDKDPDDGQVAVLLETSNEQDGWFSQSVKLDSFHALFEPAVNSSEQTLTGKWAHFGATIQAIAGAGETINLVLVERDGNNRELNVEIRPYTIQPSPQHIYASQQIAGATQILEIRFHLEQGSSASVKLDDAYILITDEE